MVIWWYGLIWYVLRSPLRPLARPCIFVFFSCSQNPISPEDVIERTGFFINPHIPYMDPMGMNKYQEMKSTKKTHIHISYTNSKQDLIKDITNSFLGRSWIVMGINPTSQVSQLMQLWRGKFTSPKHHLNKRKTHRTSWKWNNTYATL